jgi:hypothetical protein
MAKRAARNSCSSRWDGDAVTDWTVAFSGMEVRMSDHPMRAENKTVIGVTTRFKFGTWQGSVLALEESFF